MKRNTLGQLTATLGVGPSDKLRKNAAERLDYMQHILSLDAVGLREHLGGKPRTLNEALALSVLENRAELEKMWRVNARKPYFQGLASRIIGVEEFLDVILKGAEYDEAYRDDLMAFFGDDFDEVLLEQIEEALSNEALDSKVPAAEGLKRVIAVVKDVVRQVEYYDKIQPFQELRRGNTDKEDLAYCDRKIEFIGSAFGVLTRKVSLFFGEYFDSLLDRGLYFANRYDKLLGTNKISGVKDLDDAYSSGIGLLVLGLLSDDEREFNWMVDGNVCREISELSGELKQKIWKAFSGAWKDFSRGFGSQRELELLQSTIDDLEIAQAVEATIDQQIGGLRERGRGLFSAVLSLVKSSLPMLTGDTLEKRMVLTLVRVRKVMELAESLEDKADSKEGQTTLFLLEEIMIDLQTQFKALIAGHKRVDVDDEDTGEHVGVFDVEPGRTLSVWV
jgi:hypothetical protein